MKTSRAGLVLSFLLPLGAFTAAGADAGFTLGTPGAPRICNTSAADGNAWLAANVAYSAMATVAPSTNGPARAVSAVAGAKAVTLAANEAGFAVERTKPEYYLGDEVEPPANVDWSATYDKFLAGDKKGLLFDPKGERVFVTEGGTVEITWVKNDGSETPMTYVTSPACAGRPRRIYWTDEPYNAPAVNLSGKFVKFFGADELLSLKYAKYTNTVAGVEQVIEKRIVSGLFLDPTTQMLNAYGELQGQVVMAYYDTGTYEHILHVQAVEICRPDVNVMKGEIGRALKPDGRGYDTTGLRALPTVVSPTDDRGEYLYQHKGQYSYSPKNGNVYPLRPTKDCRWNAEVYWMETDEMEVQWPFELDHYECDWPADATVFVRGNADGDAGRDIYIPGSYAPTLMSYQDPEGHARAPSGDGTFTTTGEGYSLLRLTANDNIWFVPVKSVFRTNLDYFTLEPEEIAVGKELQLRGGSVAGTSTTFKPNCDPESPGYIYEGNSDRIWNAGLYKAPNAADNQPEGLSTNAVSSITSEEGADEYDSVIYAVRGGGKVEVWWNTTILEEDMPEPVTIPTLPQVYTVRWPKPCETPQIVIASQKGSGCESTFMQNNALYLSKGDSYAELADRAYFGSGGGTVTFWMRALERGELNGTASSIVTLAANSKDAVAFDLRAAGDATNLTVTVWSNGGGLAFTHALTGDGQSRAGWRHVAMTVTGEGVTVYLDGEEAGTAAGTLAGFLGAPLEGRIGAATAAGNQLPARGGVEVGELLFWNYALGADEIKTEMYKTHDGTEGKLTGCYTFIEGKDLNVETGDWRTFFEKTLDIPYRAFNCLSDENGPPARGTFDFKADAETTPKVYAQNDAEQDGYNPNEEHGFVHNGGDGYVAWALRCDLNTEATSEPGVLVEYASGGKKKMQYFAVALTNDVYTALAGECVAGKALPGPHPLDLFDDPWRPETHWDEKGDKTPAHRDRKGQLWARAAGTLTARMYYPMQEGFAFPSVAEKDWPGVGESVPWLSLLDKTVAAADVLTAKPAAWKWTVEWPEEVPEIEIGRTLTVAASGLPETWNAKSMAVVWPGTDAERDATALLFDPTVAQASGFDKTAFSSVAEVVKDLGIKQGAGGNATLRKGRWTFDGLPPSISKRFYLDTTADVENCLRLEGEMEDNAGGVSLLHVNVLNKEEREALLTLVDKTASENGKKAWREAVNNLARNPVKPSQHKKVSDSEDAVSYRPRDHYALFTMGATNYVTLIENDSTNEVMNVADGDPISMHIIKVVPKYYTGRVVTREDPQNLLSQQLAVIYAEAFAGKPDQYVFEWRKCRPRSDGTVPMDFDGEYEPKFEPSAGLTRFTIGMQGDTLANMVNTYYAMRYRAADTNSPAYAAMGDAWSEWTDPPALAEGWVQRVLNNVTPFAQRMRDLVENEAETAVSMIRQAGAPYEGDVALNQDNLTSVGLIQLYETILSKAESMSLQMEINDRDANKQLQLAVARLADLYNLLGDEAYTDALNPTIGFGSNFNTVEKTGYELDYGAMSSALFCFDNQVPSLLDEELALLRGRSGANAPSTQLSPYYNRLVWNFTRGMNAGEVAYAVNYDISGNNKGTIDYSQAAEMYPQGHGDAYGHYLSALSGYYRLLRNPYFSWGAPAMGEMVVADGVVNVDYYDEAQFAKAAYNVAKTALETVDRTARKAYRDNGGASGAGYEDTMATRNFGYGEWASRGGFGALCNWAAGNSLLAAEPSAGKFWRYRFNGGNSSIGVTLEEGIAPEIKPGGTYTIELQTVPAATQERGWGTLVSVMDETGMFELGVDETNALWLVTAPFVASESAITTYTYFYTNATHAAEGEEIASLAVTNGNEVIECWFLGEAAIPPEMPEGYAGFDAIAEGGEPQPPSWSASGWNVVGEPDEETGLFAPRVETEEFVEYVVDSNEARMEPVAQLQGGHAMHIALRGAGDESTVSVFDASGAQLTETAVNLGRSVQARDVDVGRGYDGEIGEVRFWDGVKRTNEELLAKRLYVSPLTEGLALHLRTISESGESNYLADEKAAGVYWNVSGGEWSQEQESGIAIGFEDEGLKRIDRGTVKELESLAGIVPQIQKKVDQMDAGLNPLGLAAGAVPFDIEPFGEGGGKTHYEQIRERAGTALANARKTLDRAQENANRMRLLQESQVAHEDMLETAELEFKNKLIEYFGYPYEGDIGPGGTYPQGYDGPDLYNYAWMDPTLYGVDPKDSTVTFKVVTMSKPNLFLTFQMFVSASKETSSTKRSFNLSDSGFVLKPENIGGKRRAQGKIQDALAEFMWAYATLQSKVSNCESRLADLESSVEWSTRITSTLYLAKLAAEEAAAISGFIEAGVKVGLKTGINALETMSKLSAETQDAIIDATPEIVGVGMTVNTDPRAMVSAAISPVTTATTLTTEGSMLAAKNALDTLEMQQTWKSLAKNMINAGADYVFNRISNYSELRSLWYTYNAAKSEMCGAYQELLAAQAAVETVLAEAERVIDERTLKRTQAVDTLTKMRYNEMFFRIERDNALSRYSSAFELAQKYAYLAAQAYDYETGLLAADPASGEKFLAEIVGARTPGAFGADGEPLVTSGDGDGGLADILARMDANWLVLKPRLGINNPQRYATWFSLRRELFRIYADGRGDKNWKTALQKCMVADLNALPEFKRYCQPLSGSTAEKEPGIVIEFPTEIVYGYNFFGQESAGGDSPLDPTWYATHIASAGVHFEGYDDAMLTKTPTAYLVPVGEDRMRSVGDPDVALSWKVVDQTIPVPYAIGSTQLDDPDWTPLWDGTTGGNDLGARIRKHPSFRAYYGAKGAAPSDAGLDCTRLTGRSAWNTRWLLIIPAGAMNANREEAVKTFIESVGDIKLGFKTYSASGN